MLHFRVDTNLRNLIFVSKHKKLLFHPYLSFSNLLQKTLLHIFVATHTTLMTPIIAPKVALQQITSSRSRIMIKRERERERKVFWSECLNIRYRAQRSKSYLKGSKNIIIFRDYRVYDNFSSKCCAEHQLINFLQIQNLGWSWSPIKKKKFRCQKWPK